MLFLEALSLQSMGETDAAASIMAQVGELTARDAGDIMSTLLVEGDDYTLDLVGNAMLGGLNAAFRHEQERVMAENILEFLKI